MPGVLIVEAMAQAGALLAYRSDSSASPTRPILLAGLDNVRFRRPVVPGDQLRLEVSVIKRRTVMWRLAGTASVDGQVAAEAELIAMEVDPTHLR
jgi:3-hydroxyacyl-[acyl-carrier-protein] dehydratase